MNIEKQLNKSFGQLKLTQVTILEQGRRQGKLHATAKPVYTVDQKLYVLWMTKKVKQKDNNGLERQVLQAAIQFPKAKINNINFNETNRIVKGSFDSNWPKDLEYRILSIADIISIGNYTLLHCELSAMSHEVTNGN
jgi:hypothetical protein